MSELAAAALNPRDSVWKAAVAQGKVALRKRWLAEASMLTGEYRIRYVSGGVRAERIA